ncbi:MAG: amidohydrolase [Chloroflexota bacterium]|jgi:amidohydrolase|nr:MAG: amidohydrolase [SAR202 cluster bacterium]MED5208629.1 amidohydrolase [Chloroflexota bacterium]MEE3013800.1 amidohydrolase [Chloroflexota bacterium]GIS95061.1 MAG: amidohydrolase [Dehalococcoidia bacterium]|tara:strand:- start:1153 stop:2511 length:1359 start_codon:yes stop_codon:yes gene_type:complete
MSKSTSTIEEIKKLACETIEKNKKHIIGVAQQILANPEAGFREVKTAQLVAQNFEDLGIPYQGGLALTGLKGRIPGGAGPGPTVAVIGELDSLVVTEHPHADPNSGAAHACGHHCQIGMMLGATMGLMTPDVLSQLSGQIVPFAVPAEEFIEVEQRLEMRENGQVEFLGGKQELIRLGEFDDVDIAMMCHTASDMGERKFAMGGTSNGHVVKFVRYTGIGAHAGSLPHRGVNALNAASFAIQAINSLRETHKSDDTVRIHGIMTRGGAAVSAVPSDVRLEWRVRSATPSAVVENSTAVDRCFRAGALAVGAKVEITTIPGYLPMRHDTKLQDIFRRTAIDLIGEHATLVMPARRNRGGSTDMGDLSHIMPSCHPYTAGAVGPGHSSEYLITDYESAVINPAKIMAMVTIDLLADGAKQAKAVKANHRPLLNKQSYVKFQRERAETIVFDGAS